jgi:HK97 gp10 family phage protein
MTCRYQFDLKGMSEYLEEIARAGQNVDAAAAAAVTAGGSVVHAAMLEKVPVGEAPDDPHPGNLKRHLVLTPAQQDGNFIWVDVGMDLDADADTAIYGNVQEYGSAHNHAQPYIRPSFDNNKRQVRQAEKQTLVEMGVPIE